MCGVVLDDRLPSITLMPVFVTSDRMVERAPETVAAALRAVVMVQRALKADVNLATEVGRKLFPPAELS